MKIAVLFKVVLDDQDIGVDSSGALDYSRAQNTVSTYDLNALEAAARLALASEGSTVHAFTVGGPGIDDSKLRKNVLSRGVDELFMVADESCVNLDAYACACVLAQALQTYGPYDVIISGDGSADLFAKQVDVQVAAGLDWPYVSGTVAIESPVDTGALVIKRLLENNAENLKVPLPAVVSVSPDIAPPRICGMKEILAAGKKPVHILSVGEVPTKAVEVVYERAPQQKHRDLVIYDSGSEGDTEKFIQAVKAVL
jgi:electron transfer flavoprotein beta subunit